MPQTTSVVVVSTTVPFYSVKSELESRIGSNLVCGMFTMVKASYEGLVSTKLTRHHHHHHHHHL